MKISTGIKKKPYFILPYGPPTIGKTSFAADAPNPIFLDIEKGSDLVSTNRFEDLKTWDDVLKAIDYLTNEKHDFKTAVIDTVGALESWLFEKICKQENVKTIDEAFGGYGKGYNYAVTQWIDLIGRLSTLRDKGVNIILLGHADIKTFNDPNHTLPYERYVLKLNDKAAAKLREAVDSVLFMNFEDTVFKVNKSDKKAKATGGDIRKIYTQRKAAYDAKDRLGLPEEFPLSWAEFDRLAKLGQPDSLENILKDLEEITKSTAPEVTTRIKAAIDKANGDVTTLVKIRNHARSVVE